MRRRRLTSLIVGTLFALCFAGCEQQTEPRNSKWRIDVGPDRGPADASMDVGPDGGPADASEDVTEDPEGPIWPSEGAGPRRTFRAPVTGPTDPEVLWSQENGEAFKIEEERLRPYLETEAPSDALRVADATVTSTGAIVFLSAPRETHQDADELSLTVRRLDPEGMPTWSRRLPVDPIRIDVSADDLPTRLGAIALVDDSRVAVRSANKTWSLDVETGQTLSVQEMFLGDLEGPNAEADEVAVDPWRGDEIITSVAAGNFGGSEDQWLYKTQVSVFSPTAMPNGPTLTTNSGDEFPQHIPLSPLISRPSSGQVFAREMVNKSDPEDIVRSSVVTESPNNPSWKTKLARSAPEPSDEVACTQLVAASQSRVFLFAGYGETEDHLFGAVSIQDGDLLWARTVSELPIQHTNVKIPDIAIDPQGRPVFGYGNELIAFDHDGTVRWTKDMPGQRFVAQQSMAMDSDGTLYVANLSDKHLIRGFDTQGNQLFKTSLPEDWTDPHLLAMGKDGTLILEALKIEYAGDQANVTSRIFALGDR